VRFQVIETLRTRAQCGVTDRDDPVCWESRPTPWVEDQRDAAQDRWYREHPDGEEPPYPEDEEAVSAEEGAHWDELPEARSEARAWDAFAETSGGARWKSRVRAAARRDGGLLRIAAEVGAANRLVAGPRSGRRCDRRVKIASTEVVAAAHGGRSVLCWGGSYTSSARRVEALTGSRRVRKRNDVRRCPRRCPLRQASLALTHRTPRLVLPGARQVAQILDVLFGC
jgi:hypothetical protein